jgi:hypothetical protein
MDKQNWSFGTLASLLEWGEAEVQANTSENEQAQMSAQCSLKAAWATQLQ